MIVLIEREKYKRCGNSTEDLRIESSSFSKAPEINNTFTFSYVQVASFTFVLVRA